MKVASLASVALINTVFIASNQTLVVHAYMEVLCATSEMDTVSSLKLYSFNLGCNDVADTDVNSASALHISHLDVLAVQLGFSGM